MSKKKIEPTDAMVEAVEHARKFLLLDVRTILRAALNHPDARGLLADEECAQCRLLDTAWHDLARHPAIVPPDWEPGNGQSYAEAVLARLNSRGSEDDRPWEPLDGPPRVGDEVRQDHLGVTTIAVVGRVDGEGDPWTAEDRFIGGLDLGTWYVRRAIQELPTEDGVEIVPAGGGPIGAAHPGGKFTTHHATYDSYLGSWVGVWRAASGRVTVSSVSPGDITPGTWKVAGQ